MDSQLRAIALSKIKPDSFYEQYFAKAKDFLLNLEQETRPQFEEHRRTGCAELRNFKINGFFLDAISSLTTHPDPLVVDVALNGMQIHTHFGVQPHENPILKPVRFCVCVVVRVIIS